MDSLKLPSRFQPTEVAIFVLGDAKFEAYIESVRFSDEGVILYTLQVYYDGGDENHVRLPDVPAAFMEARVVKETAIG